MYYFFGLDCLICSSFSYRHYILTDRLDYFDSQQSGGSCQLPMIRYSVVDSHYVFELRHHLTTTTMMAWAMSTRQCQQHCWISLPSSLPKPSCVIASSDDASSSPQTNDDSGVGRWVSLSVPPLFLPVYGRSIHHCPYDMKILLTSSLRYHGEDKHRDEVDT